jgi:transposase-like protein
MGTSNYSDAFKRDAVHQIRVRRYPVRAVSQRLGVSSHSLYKWLRLFAGPAPKVSGVDHEAENRRLKRELARVTEERDILKKGEPWIATGSRAMANAYFARESR